MLKITRSVSPHAAGLLSAGVVASITAVVLVESLLRGRTTSFDHAVSLPGHRFDVPGTNAAMRAFTSLGSAPVVVAVLAIVALLALRERARALAGVLVAVGVLEEGLNLALKIGFHRKRPALFFVIAAPDLYSFPSG